MINMTVVGVDLAGKEENDTGFCVLEGSKVSTEIVHTNKEILERIKEEDPDVVGIDAPFSFPESGQYRDSDMELKERGFSPLSPTFPGMKVLVKRVKSLLMDLEEYETIEVFPRATQDILSVKPSEDANEDEFDALLCAMTARKYLKDEYEDLDGVIVPEV